MRITVQVNQQGESVGEYVFNACKTATSEQEAVDLFILRHARIDLRYRVPRHGRIVDPSFPLDYLAFEKNCLTILTGAKPRCSNQPNRKPGLSR